VTRNHWLRFFFNRLLFPTHSFAQGCHRKAWAGLLTIPTDRPVVVIARPTLLILVSSVVIFNHSFKHRRNSIDLILLHRLLCTPLSTPSNTEEASSKLIVSIVSSCCSTVRSTDRSNSAHCLSPLLQMPKELVVVLCSLQRLVCALHS